MKSIDQVREFHEKFNHPIANAPTAEVPYMLMKLRVALIQEELDELDEALHNEDLLEMLDALTDLQYVLDGAYLVFGMQDIKELASTEVHRSNMSKLGADGKPVLRDDGKVLKGPNYFRPNLAKFLKHPYA